MSVRVSALVFEGGPLDLAEHSVMISLAENANDTGEAWPGVPLLARKSRLSERHVLRVLKALETDGWISVRRRVMVRRGCDRVCGSVYQMNLARLTAESRARGDMYAEPKPAPARALVAARDTVSPALRETSINTGQPGRAHDTVSPAQNAMREQVTSAPEHMTLEAGAHDMALADLVLNQRDAFCNRQGTVKEPPLPPKPPQRGGIACSLDAARESETAGMRRGVAAARSALTAEQREEFDECNGIRARRRWPPLSEAEFLAASRASAQPRSGTDRPGETRRRRRSERKRR